MVMSGVLRWMYQPRHESAEVDTSTKVPTMGPSVLLRIHPDARRPVQFVDDSELAYVMQRYREVHDMFHVLLGMPTHMLGEVCVKWVEGIQLRLPLGLLGGLFGALRLQPKHRVLYRQEHLWWALRVGRDAKFLMNIYYERHWDMDIHEMRQEFNIEEPPQSTPRKKWKDSS